MERPWTCLKVAPKLAHRSRVVVAMTRKKTAQAPSVLATTTVLSALIVNERFRLIAMVVGMRIVAHNGTELARWTCTSTQSQLFSLLAIVQSNADLHTCRSTVNSWSTESAPGLCDHRTSEERTPSTCVSCRSTRTQLYRGSIFLRTELFLWLHKQQQRSVFLQVALAINVAVDVAASCVVGGKSVTTAMQVLHDSRHGPYRTVGVFIVPRFFLYLHQQWQRPVFLQLSLTNARYVSLHTLGPFPARSKRNCARPTRGPVERRFLIEFSSIFMKILACRLSGHPVTFLAMFRNDREFWTPLFDKFYFTF